MPELPEVETVVRTLRPILCGRTITVVDFPYYKSNGNSSRVLDRLLSESPAAMQEKLSGRRVREIQRHGKNILLALERAGNHDKLVWLLVHLGMTGRMQFESVADPVQAHTHVVFSLDRPGCWLHFSDSRRFGKLRMLEEPLRELKKLGPDPLEISSETFYERVHSRRAMLKSLLLDQRFLRGMGNIYTDESLSRARLHPAAIASRLRRSDALRLHSAIREILTRAIELGGSSISNYVDAQGRAGWFQQVHRVYGRAGEPCHRCGAPIRRMIIASRSTHYCPRCQRTGRPQPQRKTAGKKRTR